jgi:glycosyltransferase involved in cell wall biosynthesis
MPSEATYRSDGNHRLSIMFVSNLYPPRITGGAEMSTHALARGFAERGDKVSVFTLKEGGEPEETIEEGIRIFRYPAAIPYWPFDQKPQSTARKIAYHLWDNYNLIAGRQMRAVMREVRPDIVSTQGLTGISAAAWPAAHSIGAKAVHSIRDYNMMCRSSTLYRDDKVCVGQCGDCKLLTLGRKWVGRGVDGVIANSAYVRSRHIEAGYFPNAQWDVVPPTIDPRMMGAEVAHHGGPVRFGFAGRISREKGPEWLIDAFEAMKRRDWTCMIAGRGDPDYIARLQAKCDDRVTFAGWIAPADFYSSIDVLVAPSLWAEPAGRIIAEAYGHGLPVISARNGGMTESVEPGVTGWLVEPGSVEDLAVALDQAADPAIRASMDRSRMRALAAERTTDTAIGRYTMMFERVLAR